MYERLGLAIPPQWKTTSRTRRCSRRQPPCWFGGVSCRSARPPRLSWVVRAPQASCGQCPIGDTTRRTGFQGRSFPSRLNRRFIRSVFMNMKNKLGVGWLALAAVLVLADRSRGEDIKLDLPAMGGAAVSPDGATLVVSLTGKAELVYIDTVTGKEGKRVS